MGLSYALEKVDNNFIDEKLKELFVNLCFPKHDDQIYPEPTLMKDPLLAKNSLKSFLGGDRAKKLSKLIGTDNANPFSSKSLHLIVEKAIGNLNQSTNIFSNWTLILAIIGDLPPYKNLKDHLKELILKTDYKILIKEDIKLINFAVLPASYMSFHLNDSKVRSYLKEQLIEIAKRLAQVYSNNPDAFKNTNQGFYNANHIWMLLVEVVNNLSVSTIPKTKVTEEFVDLLSDIINVCKPVVPVIRPAVQRLCEELPISQAKKFWPLLIRLRAE